MDGTADEDALLRLSLYDAIATYPVLSEEEAQDEE
jgi:hypothetical protein